MNKREIGSVYEKKAVEHLIRNGYKVIHQNFRSRIGEIDIIAKDEDYLVFIEVKYRKNANIGFPSESINKNKILRISKTAQYYMQKNRLSEDIKCRFDLVIILGDKIDIIKNAFNTYDGG